MKTFKQFIAESIGSQQNEQQLYNTIYSKLQQKLGGTPIPQDITRYGVTADLNGLTLLMMKVAYKESNFYNAAKGDSGYFSKPAANGGTIPGGSHGLFQLSPVDAQTYNFLGFKGNGNVIANTNGIKAFSIEQLQDPYFNIDLTTSIWADSIKKHGTVANRITKGYGWIADREMGKLARYTGNNVKSDGGNGGMLAATATTVPGASPEAGSPQQNVADAGQSDSRTDYGTISQAWGALSNAVNLIRNYGKSI
jgi:hypothetical protein